MWGLRGSDVLATLAQRMLKSDDDKQPGDAPTTRPTGAPSLEVSGSTAAEPWYSSDAFIVSCVLIGVFLIVGAALKFWWMTKASKARGEFENSDGSLGSGFGGSNSGFMPGKGQARFDSEKGGYDYGAAESAALLGSGGSSNAAAAAAAVATLSSSSGAASKKPAVAAFSITTELPKFSQDDLQDAEEATLAKKFAAVMAAGLVISLHTTKGPKPVLLSLVGDEVRWQAVKTAQKRYKLNVRDVTYVTAGKTTSNFSRARMADDRLCFSLLTNKTTLDLEASSTLERDCLHKGFKMVVERAKSVCA